MTRLMFSTEITLQYKYMAQLTCVYAYPLLGYKSTVPALQFDRDIDQDPISDIPQDQLNLYS
jgi:hypothetical protein